MRTITKKLAFIALLSLGLAACKKDQKDPEPAPPTPAVAISFADLKALSTSASVNLPDAKKIAGIVISDVSAKNIDSKSVVVQDGNNGQGIIITFDGAQTFAVGDRIEVVVSKQTLAQVNGEMVIQNVPKANATKIASSQVITPRSTTITDLLTNATAWDGTLVTLPEGLLTGGSSRYSGTLGYTDGTKNIKSQVLAGAAFENTAYPAAVHTLTGVVRVNGTDVHVDIRNTTDVVAKEGYFITEDFSTADVGYISELKMKSGSYFGAQQIETDLNVVGSFLNTNTNVGGLNQVKIIGANDADKSFLTQGRKYLSVLPVLEKESYDAIVTPDYADLYDQFFNNGIFLPVHNNLGGFELSKANTITIVFAGSFMSAADYKTVTDAADAVTSMTWNPFDPAKHGFKLQLVDGYGAVLYESEMFHDQGIWHTVTLSNVGSKIANKSYWLNLVNGLKRGDLVAPYTLLGPDFAFGTPIIIDKIVFGWDQKPTWAK